MPGHGTTGTAGEAKTQAEFNLDEMMDWALVNTNREREDTIVLFRQEFEKVADYNMLMALIGQTEFYNAMCRLRAKRVRSRNISQTNLIKAQRTRG